MHSDMPIWFFYEKKTSCRVGSRKSKKQKKNLKFIFSTQGNAIPPMNNICLICFQNIRYPQHLPQLPGRLVCYCWDNERFRLFCRQRRIRWKIGLYLSFYQIMQILIGVFTSCGEPHLGKLCKKHYPTSNKSSFHLRIIVILYMYPISIKWIIKILTICNFQVDWSIIICVLDIIHVYF